MTYLLVLWLPILVSAVLVFLVSAVMHMVLPLHRNDFAKLPGEDGILAAFRKAGVPAGDYMFPHCGSMKEMGSAEMKAKFDKGPVGSVTILPPGPFNMGRSLLQWFLYCILIGTFVAYVDMFALAPGANYMQVFELTARVAILGYAFAAIPNSIWKGAKWSSTAKFVFDGLVYGLVTAGTFGWLWPSAAPPA